MSRSGYCDDLDHLALGRWRGRVASATRGKRGQRFLRELRDALDAMPEKRLITDRLVEGEECCAIGSVLLARLRAGTITQEQVDGLALDYDDSETVADSVDIAEPLAREIMYLNDEHFPNWTTEGYRDRGPRDDPARRWKAMRDWVDRKIKEDARG